MKKINAKLSALKCPICGSNAIYGDCRPSQVVSYHEDESGNLIVSTPPSIINCIRAHCIGCGFVMQFKENVFLKK